MDAATRRRGTLLLLTTALLCALAQCVHAEDKANAYCSADPSRPVYAYLTYVDGDGESHTEEAVLASFGAVPPQDAVRVSLAKPFDGCQPAEEHRGVLAGRGNCTFLQKALAAESASAPLLVVASNVSLPAWRGGAWSMGCTSVEQVAMGSSNLSVVAVMVPQDAGARIRDALRDAKEANVTASVALLKSPFVDGSAFVLLFLALATLGLGSAWSCAEDYGLCIHRINAAQRRRRLREERRRHLGAAASRRRGEGSEEGESEDEDDDEQYNTSLEVTPRTAACFVVFASTMLVTLYFLISDVMYAVVLAFFAIAAAIAFAAFLRFFVGSLLFERALGIEDWHVWVSQDDTPSSPQAERKDEDGNAAEEDESAEASEEVQALLQSLGKQNEDSTQGKRWSEMAQGWARSFVGPAGISVMDATCAVLAIGTTVAWLVCRSTVVAHSDATGGLAPAYASDPTMCAVEAAAWVLQDLLGVSFMAHVLRGIRLPNLKVACILLPCCFLYDVFWVFIQPLLLGGKSVMVSVATGQGRSSSHASGTLPMLLTVPRLNSPLGGYSLLGYGDVVLPGLLIAFTLRRDLWARLRASAERRFGGAGRAEHQLTEIGVDDPPKDVLLRLLAAQGTASGGTRSYAIPCVAAYVMGLALTFIALKLNVGGQRGQPALLYLVPSTLGVVSFEAIRRGEWRGLWSGDAARGIVIKLKERHNAASV